MQHILNSKKSLQMSQLLVASTPHLHHLQGRDDAPHSAPLSQTRYVVHVRSFAEQLHFKLHAFPFVRQLQQVMSMSCPVAMGSLDRIDSTCPFACNYHP